MARDIRPLGDSALERELEALLAVEPSVGFDARVRARVADRREATAPWSLTWRWLLVPAGVCAAAIVAFVLLRPVEAPPGIAAVLPGRSLEVSPATRPPVVTSETLSPRRGARSTRARRAAHEQRFARQVESAILISPREGEAIKSLLARAEPLHLRLVSAGVFESLSATRPVEPLDVAPIVIDPVRPTRGLPEGVWP